jgi:hypothetical protein
MLAIIKPIVFVFRSISVIGCITGMSFCSAFAQGNVVDFGEKTAVPAGKATTPDLVSGTSAVDEETKRLAERLKQEIVASNKKSLLRLRKVYASSIRHILWQHDVAVRLSGPKKDVITFTGAYFVSGNNIAKTQETIADILLLLRFSQVNYKRERHAQQFTYFTLNDPKDEVSVP